MSQILKQYASSRHLMMPAIGEEMALRYLSRDQLVPIYLSARLAASSRQLGTIDLATYSELIHDLRLGTNLPLIVDLNTTLAGTRGLAEAAKLLTRAGADILLLESTADADDEQVLDELHEVQDALNGKTEIWTRLDGQRLTIAAMLQRMSSLSCSGSDALVLTHTTTQMLALAASQPRHTPLLASWKSGQAMTAPVDGWLDNGDLLRDAQRAQQAALMAFMGETVYVQR